MKKLFAVLLALTLVLSMGTIALATDGDAVTPTGSITISNAINGATYNIYKMFDFAPVAGSETQGRYTVVAEWEGFLTGAGAAYLKANAETGTIEWNGDETDARKAELAKAAIAYAKANSIAATATETASGEKVEFTGLALGYYAIDTSLGTLCALTNTNSDFTATEKNEKPDLVKKIVEGEARVDANNVAIGDTVTYEATITIGVGAQNYVMHDKMSDTLKFTGVKSVTVNGVEVDAGNYSVVANPEDGCTFDVEFKDSYTSTLAKGTNIVVTYTAELKENAIVGAEGNPNEAWLEYGDEHETIHDYVITYTTKYVVDKVDGDDKPLTGAEFTLSKLVDGSWVKIDTVVVDTTGTNFTWNGLSEGQYKLEETKVPDGFNKAKDIEFTITCEEPTEVTATTDKADWTDTEADGVDNVAEDADTFKSTVVNKTGSLLPETGGIGTTIFYVVGSILMLAALVLLVSKKRMANFA